MTVERVHKYFNEIAPDWDVWRKKNNYFHKSIEKFICGHIVPHSSVLEIGCGAGDLLSKSKPSWGVGLNVSQTMNNIAMRRHPNLTFITVSVDQVEIPKGFSPDYIILNNMLDYVNDIWDLFSNIKKIIHSETIILIVTTNPLWSPLMRMGSSLKLRTPNSARNYITNQDISNVLRVLGIEIVSDELLLPCPKYIPLISSLLNTVIPELPILKYLSSSQWLVARPQLHRHNLSCSIVIPCHNEEKNIERTIKLIPEMNFKSEIIVVDDGSNDNTKIIVQSLIKGNLRLRLLALKKNYGKAMAVFTGFKEANGDIVIILDADAAVDPTAIPKFVEAIGQGRADFVNGTRLIYPMEDRAMKFSNFIGNKFFCYLTSWALRQRVSDTLCGTKALLKRDFLKMPQHHVDRWGDFTLLFGAGLLSSRIREIPVHYKERIADKSKMKAFIEVWRFILACLYGAQLIRKPDFKKVLFNEKLSVEYDEI